MKESILRRLFKTVWRLTIVVFVVILAVWFYIAQPSFQKSLPVEHAVNQARMIETVRTLSETYHPRTFNHKENLDAVANYIEQHFRQTNGVVTIQEFQVSEKTYSNISCIFGNPTKPRLIIGAHYDSHYDTPGADDNASGIAGLIELAYLFNQTNEAFGTIELVAYSLEEPPFFGSSQMGSYIHAANLEQSNTALLGVIVLEMIGYFSDDFGSQTYPAKLFNLIYPNTGNFIAIIGKTDQRTFTKQVKIGMKGATELPVYSINAPQQIPGIDFSDHRNYWHFGRNAVMITDTAFYRNQSYHTVTDTWDTLDYQRMGDAIKGVYSASLKLTSEPPE